MTDIMGKINGWYDDNESQFVHIKEYGEDFYFAPLTANDVSGVYNKIQGGDLKAMVSLLIKTAKTKDGSPMFTLADKLVLVRKMPINALNTYVNALVSDLDDVDEIAGN